MKRLILVGIALAVGLASGWPSPALAAPTDAEKCESFKLKHAGKYALCRMKADSKAIKKGEEPDYSKCDEKIVKKFDKAESRWGVECPTSGDVDDIQSFVTAHSDAVAAALAGGTLSGGACMLATGQTTAYGTGSDGDVEAGLMLSYTDNGDGTITDNNTGLMWEKKDDSGGIHDKDNAYSWCEDVSPADSVCDNGTEAMDGTIVTTFLDTLNDVAGGETSCFAGYCDWRVPNYKELASILDLELSNPAVDPAFHQAGTCTGCLDVTQASCSCTYSTFYWSSTTDVSDPSSAWGVVFDDGLVFSTSKTGFSLPARAVRGGL